jgi:hypothetical protein
VPGTRLRAQRSTDTGLIVAKDRVVEEAFGEIDIRPVRMRATGRRVITTAFRAGWAAGDRVNLNRPMRCPDTARLSGPRDRQRRRVYLWEARVVAPCDPTTLPFSAPQALASFLIGAEAAPSEVVAGVALCLMAGVVVGGFNGALVRGAGINPVITTIATLSVLQGIALFLRPAPGGGINADFMDLLAVQVGGIPLSFYVILAAAIAGDVWLYNTRSGLQMRAVGFREQAARRNGVHIDFVHMRAYLMSGLLAVGAGFFLSSEVGVGHPVIGQGYTLTSIAAAVLGGAALNGGRGSFIGGAIRRAVLHHHG